MNINNNCACGKNCSCNKNCSCEKHCSCSSCNKGQSHCAKNSAGKVGRVEKAGHEQNKFHHICGDMGCKKKY